MNEKISTKRKALVVVTALTLIFSSSVMAFAASTQSGTQGTTSTQVAKVSMTDEQRSAIEQARAASVTEALAQLVKAGTITQEEADKVSTSTVKTEKTSQTGVFANLTEDQRQALEEERQTVMSEAIASLVNAGTITQEQADQFTPKDRTEFNSDITTEQREAIQQAREAARTAAITSLVSAGTITQTEADAIAAKSQTGHKAGSGTTASGLTEDQMKALMTAEQAQFKTELTSLVSAGTITQDQADKFTTVATSITKEKTNTESTLTDEQKTAIKEAQENCMTKAVSNLVADGTITQSVADQLDTFTASKEKSASSQNDVLTTDQRTALQEAVKTSFESKLAALVTAGTITQEQSDLFANADGHNGFGGGGFDHRGFGGHDRPDSNATQNVENSGETE